MKRRDFVLASAGSALLASAAPAAATVLYGDRSVMLDKIRPIHGRRGRPRFRPDKLHADKAYDHVFCRAGCQIRGVIPRIARRGIESAERLGRHRWVVERSFAWLHTSRRLATRYERRADIHRAFLHLGAALICFNSVARSFVRHS